MRSAGPLDCSRRGLLARGLVAGAAAALGEVPLVAGARDGALTGAPPARRALPETNPLVALPVPPQAPANTALAQLPNVRLWYWDSGGQGEPVILLHPMTGSALVWVYQQPVLARAGYRVIAYSRRGHNGSEAGPADQPGNGAQDLDDLLSVLGIDKFHAVASAAGGFVAAAYAVTHPQRLHTLTLACSLLGIEDPALANLTNGLRTPGFEALPAYFRELGPSYRACDPDGTQRWRELESISMTGRRIEQPAGPRLTLASLERLSVPTLLIAGDSDLLAPPPVARLFARHIRNCRLEVIPECGHSAYWERPDLFNDLVEGFLTGP
jgi:pimeloyl-ACP methyl ester carboxylesterase